MPDTPAPKITLQKKAILSLDDLADALRSYVASQLVEGLADSSTDVDELAEACLDEAYELEINVSSPVSDDGSQTLIVLEAMKPYDSESCISYRTFGFLCMECATKKVEYQNDQHEVMHIFTKEKNNAYTNASIKGGVNFNA